MFQWVRGENIKFYMVLGRCFEVCLLYYFLFVYFVFFISISNYFKNRFKYVFILDQSFIFFE